MADAAVDLLRFLLVSSVHVAVLALLVFALVRVLRPGGRSVAAMLALVAAVPILSGLAEALPVKVLAMLPSTGPGDLPLTRQGKGPILPLANLGEAMSEPRDELVPGTLEMLVLKVLAHGAMHGYAVARRLRQVSEDVLRVEEGSLYPALHRMERRGWLRSAWGLSEANRRAKYYRITPRGRKRLDARRAEWQRMSEAIARVLRAAPGEA